MRSLAPRHPEHSEPGRQDDVSRPDTPQDDPASAQSDDEHNTSAQSDDEPSDPEHDDASERSVTPEQDDQDDQDDPEPAFHESVSPEQDHQDDPEPDSGPDDEPDRTVEEDYQQEDDQEEYECEEYEYDGEYDKEEEYLIGNSFKLWIWLGRPLGNSNRTLANSPCLINSPNFSSRLRLLRAEDKKYVKCPVRVEGLAFRKILERSIARTNKSESQ